MAKSRVDWIKVKTDYITGSCTYQSLAAKYGVSRSAIEKRAKAEGWIKLRTDYCGNVVEKVVRKIGTTKENALLKEFETVDILSDSIHKAVHNKALLYQYKTKDNKVVILDTINTRTLLDVLQALSYIVNFKKEFAKMIDEKDRLQIQLEYDKFEHQKCIDLEKLELAKSKNNIDENEMEYGVVVLPMRADREQPKNHKGHECSCSHKVG